MAEYSTPTNFKGLSTQNVPGSFEKDFPFVAQFAIDAEIVRITDNAVLQLPYISRLPSSSVFFVVYYSSSSVDYSLTFSAPPATLDVYGNQIVAQKINGRLNAVVTEPTTIQYFTEAAEVDKPMFFIVAGNNNHYSVKQIFEGGDNVRKINGVLSHFQKSRYSIERCYMTGEPAQNYPPMDKAADLAPYRFRPMCIRHPNAYLCVGDTPTVGLFYGKQKGSKGKKDTDHAKAFTLTRAFEAPHLGLNSPNYSRLSVDYNFPAVAGGANHQVPDGWSDSDGMLWENGSDYLHVPVSGVGDPKPVTLNPIQFSSYKKADQSTATIQLYDKSTADGGVPGAARSFTVNDSVDANDEREHRVFFRINEDVVPSGTQYKNTKIDVEVVVYVNMVMPAAKWAYNTTDYDLSGTFGSSVKNTYNVKNCFGGMLDAIEFCSMYYAGENTKGTAGQGFKGYQSNREVKGNVGKNDGDIIVYKSIDLTVKDIETWSSNTVLNVANGYWADHNVKRDYGGGEGYPPGYLSYQRITAQAAFTQKMTADRLYYFNFRTSGDKVNFNGDTNIGDQPDKNVVDSPFICCFTPNSTKNDQANYGPFYEHIEVHFREVSAST